MKLCITFDVPGWAHHNRALALQKYAPPGITVDIFPWASIPWQSVREYDLWFNVDYASDMRAQLDRHGFRGVYVVSFNADHQRREQHFRRTVQVADFTIINNKAAFEHYGRLPRTCAISNGVDTEFWRSYGNERPNRVLWTGSDNPAKGKGYQDILLPLKPLLEADGFEVDYRPVSSIRDPRVMSRDQMRNWYNSGRFILCASKSEASPNTTLEGMACGCVAVTTEVGNALEIGGGIAKGVMFASRVDSFRTVISMANQHFEHWQAGALNAISEWSYEVRAQVFFDLFHRLVAGESVEPFSYDEL